MSMKVCCGCYSTVCKEMIEASYSELIEARKNGQVIISNNCPWGPDHDDCLIEKREGYSVYFVGKGSLSPSPSPSPGPS